MVHNTKNCKNTYVLQVLLNDPICVFFRDTVTENVRTVGLNYIERGDTRDQES